MADELYRQYVNNGLVICPAGDYKRLKMRMDQENEDYHESWDNSMQVYIFEAKKGMKLI